METISTTVSNADAKRIEAYAESKGLDTHAAAAALLDAGLRAWDRARNAGSARAANRTPEEQAAAAHAMHGQRRAAEQKRDERNARRRATAKAKKAAN